ncbi:hypothetical protein [Pseudophaeobacter leonis]|uniref:hypothetical protein n=1 Tax=Pseudophaeobacter leonis TaxID=1144477 RepID=UPI00111C4D6C|nr:hypothetical protein [Pseudophaeobacter leonis]
MNPISAFFALLVAVSGGTVAQAAQSPMEQFNKALAAHCSDESTRAQAALSLPNASKALPITGISADVPRWDALWGETAEFFSGGSDLGEYSFEEREFWAAVYTFSNGGELAIPQLAMKKIRQGKWPKPDFIEMSLAMGELAECALLQLDQDAQAEFGKNSEDRNCAAAHGAAIISHYQRLNSDPSELTINDQTELVTRANFAPTRRQVLAFMPLIFMGFFEGSKAKLVERNICKGEESE